MMKRFTGFLALILCLLFTNVISAAEPAPARSRLFPILGDKVPEEMKDQLPLPFGLSFNFVRTLENLNVSNWDMRINDEVISPDAIKATKLKQETDIESIRLDAWVLPFLNLYGIFGNVEGHISDIQLGLIGEPVPTSFKIPFDGIVYGGGVTVAAGYKMVFVTCDVNYTYTEINIWDSATQTLMTTPRAGIRIPFKKINVSLYSGANNERILNRLHGSYVTTEGSRLDIALDASPHAPWVPLAGTMIEFGKHFAVILEGTFGDREMGICSLTYRW
jgi:hypothetical protein